MAAHAMVSLVLGLLLLLCSSTAIATEVGIETLSIDAVNGSDTLQCITGLSPCRSLQYAVSHRQSNTIFVLQSHLLLEAVVTFSFCRDVTISGQLHCNESCSNSTDGCGLLFENCDNVILRNLTVHRCGIHSHIPYKGKKIPIKSGVMIKDGTGATIIDGFTASENTGFGTVVFNTGNTVSISNSKFTDNALNITPSLNTSIIGGGGLYIIISCDITVCPNSGWEYNIFDSKFLSNQQKWHYSPNEHLWTMLFGGGLNILLGSGSVKNRFTIQRCIFSNNTGLFGGGMFIGCEDSCNNNMIEVGDSEFVYNSPEMGKGGGGGLAIIITGPLQNLPQNNSILFYNSNFSHNCGRYGAGTYVFAGSMHVDPVVNHVNFTSCNWTNNNGSISPAVDVAPDVRHQDGTRFIVTTKFSDCIFDSNRVTIYRNETTCHPPGHSCVHYMQENNYAGVFLATKLPIYFSGVTIFNKNDGTALYLTSSVATFLEGSIVNFTNNSGMYGGAVALHAFSQLQYQDNTSFTFLGNKASLGGAIYVRIVDQHLAFASYTCFLSYSYLSSDESPCPHCHRPNNVSFYFHLNSASTNVSDSMYMTSVYPCMRVCGLKSPETIFGNNSCLGNFKFGIDSPAHVATDGSMANLRLPDNQTHFLIIPGEIRSLPIDVYDNFQQDVTGVAFYTANLLENCSSYASIAPAFTYVASNYISLLGIPNTNCTLILSMYGALETRVEIRFKFSWCRPGFVLDKREGPKSRCVCSVSMERQYHYHGITQCNSTVWSDAAIIDPGLWVGYNSNHELTQSHLYTADCPLGYCNPNITQLNVSAEKLGELMCSRNRQGFLCGKCKHRTSVFFNSDFTCQLNRNCHLGFLLYIVCELLPISLLFIAIILGDISLTSGVAYSTVFIAQMLFTVKFSVSEATPFISFTTINRIYGVLDLNFEVYPFCLWTGADALDMLVLKYVSVLYALGLVICTILLVNYINCGRLSRCLRLNRQHSFVQGLTAFLVICYSQCTRVTFMILTMSYAVGMGKETSKRVVFFAGEMDYFHHKHLPYAIPALFVLTGVVTPLPLLLLFDPFLLQFEGLLVRWHLLNRRLPWTIFRTKFKPLFDSFQGCFRDDARYFAGLFFLYRTIIYITFTAVLNMEQFYIYSELIFILMLTIQATVQPFQEKWHNIFSSVVFFILLCINTLTIRIYSLVQSEGYSTQVKILLAVQTVLASLPLLVGLVLCARWCIKKLPSCKRRDYLLEDSFASLNRSNSYGSLNNNNNLSPH